MRSTICYLNIRLSRQFAFQGFMTECTHLTKIFAGLRVEPVLMEGPNFHNDEPLWINLKHGVRYLDGVRTLREITGKEV